MTRFVNELWKMVLRSGIIIPFQFRDCKKLLMIGVPEENRDLSIWDLKNVVRAAFGIYNFEFRNKKIGFNIPDELLLHYLAQRRDLTNFVIEIGQAAEHVDSKENISFEASCSQKPDLSSISSPKESNGLSIGYMPNYPSTSKRIKSLSDNRSDDFAYDQDVLNGIRAAQAYSKNISESMAQPIIPLAVVPKSEENEVEMDGGAPKLQADPHIPEHQQHRVQPALYQHQQEHLPPQQQHQIHCYTECGVRPPVGPPPPHQRELQHTPLPTSHIMNRFRIYEPCKDSYTSISNCTTCHCSVGHKTTLDMHDNTNTSAYHPVSGRSNTSVASSQNSQNADELPVLKMRMMPHTNTSASDISHMEIEPKIDYDTPVNAGGVNADVDDASPPPPLPLHAKSSGFIEEDQQQHQQELHLERLHNEYILQQQQHQQQQQQQQHFEVLMQETSGNTLRQRKERMSKKQKEVYVNFLEQNPLINEHRRNDPALDQYWMKLADILNSVPQGAVKHVAEWKQTFDNWRYRVFLYARYNSKITGPEALNPKSFKPLTHTDKRAYQIWIRNPDTAPPDLEKMRNVFVNLEETQQD